MDQFRPKAWLAFEEEELSYLLSLLPEDEPVIRPYLQKAGENRFGW